MSLNVNKVTLAGRVTDPPSIQEKYATLTLEVEMGYGQNKFKEFIKLLFRNPKQFPVLEKYVNIDSNIFIEDGSLKGLKDGSMSVEVRNFKLNGKVGNASNQNAGNQRPSYQQQPQGQQPQNQANFPEPDDDLPF